MSLKVESTGLIQDGSPVISKIQISFSQKGHFPRLPGPIFLEVTIEAPTPTNLKVLKSLLLKDLLKASFTPGSVGQALLYNTPYLWSSSVSRTPSSHSHHLAGQPLSPAAVVPSKPGRTWADQAKGPFLLVSLAVSCSWAPGQRAQPGSQYHVVCIAQQPGSTYSGF